MPCGSYPKRAACLQPAPSSVCTLTVVVRTPHVHALCALFTQVTVHRQPTVCCFGSWLCCTRDLGTDTTTAAAQLSARAAQQHEAPLVTSCACCFGRMGTLLYGSSSPAACCFAASSAAFLLFLFLVVLQHCVVWWQQRSSDVFLRLQQPCALSCLGGESTVSYTGSSAPVVYCCGFS